MKYKYGVDRPVPEEIAIRATPTKDLPYGWSWPYPGSSALRRVAHRLELAKAAAHRCAPDWWSTWVQGYPNQDWMQISLLTDELLGQPSYIHKYYDEFGV